MTVFYSIFIVVMLLSPLITSKKLSKIGIVLAFFYIFLISALRGNFTIDYSNYVDIYILISQLEIKDFFQSDFKIFYVEKGFAIINFILSRISVDPQTIFVFTSSVITYAFYKYALIFKERLLYILLFISIGPLFQSFNIMRQIFAVAICMFGYQYIFKGNFKKYALVVSMAGTIHVSAFLMLPFYFLLRIKLSIKDALIQILMGVGVLLFFDYIMNYFDVLFFNGKYETWVSENVVVWKTIVIPILIAMFIITMLWRDNKRINKLKKEYAEDKMKILYKEPSDQAIMANSICCNGTIYWILTYIFAFKEYYISRYSAYFAIFAIMAILYSVESISDGRFRWLIRVLLILCLSAYYLFFGQYFGEYIFCF